MPRVLLVDDDPAILRLLEVNFRLEGFETLTASRGEDALAAVAEGAPDAVVLDVMLPGIDGREVYRRLREDPSSAALPVVFLTARPGEEEHTPPGAVCLGKPFDPQELVETVRRAIEGSPA